MRITAFNNCNCIVQHKPNNYDTISNHLPFVSFCIHGLWFSWCLCFCFCYYQANFDTSLRTMNIMTPMARWLNDHWPPPARATHGVERDPIIIMGSRSIPAVITWRNQSALSRRITLIVYKKVYFSIYCCPTEKLNKQKKQQEKKATQSSAVENADGV